MYLYDNPLPSWDMDNDWRFSSLRDIVHGSGHRVADGSCAGKVEIVRLLERRVRDGHKW